jgi:hypothetical protein
MTAKAAAQFDYGPLIDAPYRDNLRAQATQRLIKKVSQKPVSRGPVCLGSRLMNLRRIFAMAQN